VGLPNNSYKPITNTAWIRARLCKLQKWCTRLAAASDKFTSCLRKSPTCALFNDLIDLFIVFNAIFSNFSAISWRPVLVVEKAGVSGENHDHGQATGKFITCGCESSAPFL
jgi:hypothetical protein